MTERHRLRAVGTLAYMNGIVPIRVQPLYLIGVVASPLAFLFFIFIASRGQYTTFGIAGGLLLTVLSIGTSLQTDISHYKQDLKFHDVLVASPVEAPAYVAGLALSELLYATPGIAIFVLFWALAKGSTLSVITGLQAAGVLLLVWAFGSALGFTIATYFADVRETFAVSPLISLGLSTLPPVYYPLSLLQQNVPQFAFLAYLAPTTYPAQLLQNIFGLIPALSWETQLVDWLVLLGFTAGLFLLAALRSRWRDV